jgi:hypothetical protein
VPVVPTTGEAQTGGSLEPRSSGPAWATYNVVRLLSRKPKPNQNKKKKTQSGGMAQGVEHLLCKYKAFISKPNPTKKKKKK